LAALRAAPDAGTREAIAHRVGVAVGRLHAAGVDHADLNLGNILGDAGEGTIVDLDRARMVPGPGGVRLRQRNVGGLRRAARKLDPDGVTVDAAIVRHFATGYATALEIRCAS